MPKMTCVSRVRGISSDEHVEGERGHESTLKHLGELFELDNVLEDVNKTIGEIVDTDEHFNRSHRQLNRALERLERAKETIAREKSSSKECGGPNVALRRGASVSCDGTFVQPSVRRRKLEELSEMCAAHSEGIRFAREHINACIQRRALAGVPGARRDGDSEDHGDRDEKENKRKKRKRGGEDAAKGERLILVKDWVMFVEEDFW